MCVFLALAALYESWSLPLAVILVVPLCLLCSVTGVLASHGVVDIFVQIGLVVLVGLACKNSILIVEFARDLHAGGPAPLRGHGGGLAAAAAADPHDLVRLHPGRGPPGDRHGRRGRDAALAGNGRLQRHDRRDALRHLPHARLLLRHSRLERAAALHRRHRAVDRLLAVRRAVRGGDRIPAGAARGCTQWPWSIGGRRRPGNSRRPGRSSAFIAGIKPWKKVSP